MMNGLPESGLDSLLGIRVRQMSLLWPNMKTGVIRGVGEYSRIER